jgi:hypothetical protein
LAYPGKILQATCPIITGYVPCNLIPRAYPRIPATYPGRFSREKKQKNHKSPNTNRLPLKKVPKNREKIKEKEGKKGKLKEKIEKRKK